MDRNSETGGRLLALSDMHVRYRSNRAHVESLRSDSSGDWLLIAGDVGERIADIQWALGCLADRFSTVVWVPGNHELWTPEDDPVQLRGERRYHHLVDVCRALGVITPEDPYPVWHGVGGPVTVVPLFLGYDHTFRMPGRRGDLTPSAGPDIRFRDDQILHSDPHPSLEAWCRARLRCTRRRLETELPGRPPAVFVNHYPLVCPPWDFFRNPRFAQRCGTTATADWHRRFETAAVVYGHLHHPRTHWHENVRFEEVSVGRPSEWRPRGDAPPPPRQILPVGP